MTQLVARIDAKGDTMTVSLISPSREGISSDEKMLAARLVKTFASDEVVRPIASKMWLHGQQPPKGRSAGK